jgi:hypothetical protein
MNPLINRYGIKDSESGKKVLESALIGKWCGQEKILKNNNFHKINHFVLCSQNDEKWRFILIWNIKNGC